MSCLVCQSYLKGVERCGGAGKGRKIESGEGGRERERIGECRRGECRIYVVDS